MVFIAIKFEKPITLSQQKVNAFVNSCLDKGAILLESLWFDACLSKTVLIFVKYKLKAM